MEETKSIKISPEVTKKKKERKKLTKKRTTINSPSDGERVTETRIAAIYDLKQLAVNKKNYKRGKGKNVTHT